MYILYIRTGRGPAGVDARDTLPYQLYINIFVFLIWIPARATHTHVRARQRIYDKIRGRSSLRCRLTVSCVLCIRCTYIYIYRCIILLAKGREHAGIIDSGDLDFELLFFHSLPYVRVYIEEKREQFGALLSRTKGPGNRELRRDKIYNVKRRDFFFVLYRRKGNMGAVC